jgi:3-phosphoglycerate kinase
MLLDTEVEEGLRIPADWEAVDATGRCGVFEIDATAKGTIAIAEALAMATAAGATTIIGGGDSASSVKNGGRSKQGVAHVDGRRGVAGVPGRQGVAGGRGAQREVR